LSTLPAVLAAEMTTSSPLSACRHASRSLGEDEAISSSFFGAVAKLVSVSSASSTWSRDWIGLATKL
jgi:hypothetical protein